VKKFLLALAIFLSPLVSFAESVTPTEIYLDENPDIVIDSGSDRFYMFLPDGSNNGYVTSGDSPCNWAGACADGTTLGVWHFLLTDDASCNGLDYDDCLLDPSYLDLDIAVEVFETAPSSGGSGLPSMTASTSAVFSSIGLDSEMIYGVFQGIVGVAVDFGLFLVQISWPFLLGIAFIYLMWRLAHKFMGFGR